MENKLNIHSFRLPSLFISEKVRLKLKSKNIWINDRYPHENIFKQWVIDWLRDEQNIFIQIMCKRASNTPWWYVVKRSYKTTFTEVLAQQTYISYKECEEAAILAALELV